MNRRSLACDAPSLDLQELVDRCLGNLALVERIVAKFEAGFDRDLAELEAAVLEQDSNTAALLAHRLKGASANVSAQGLSEAAASIEKFSREGSISQVPEAVAVLRGERLRFTQAIASLAEDLPNACQTDPAAMDRLCRREGGMVV